MLQTAVLLENASVQSKRLAVFGNHRMVLSLRCRAWQFETTNSQLASVGFSMLMCVNPEHYRERVGVVMT